MVSLVVTIVVLIILSGITINLTIGENGIITKAKEAAEMMENVQIKEQEELNQIYNDIKEDYNSVKISDLRIGWTLGNTLDCNIEQPDSNPSSFETEWGNPITTKEMIAKVKQAGYNTILIPVTWYLHLDENNNINSDWMNRVEEIVDYGLDNGMYVILNTHHDDKNIELEGNAQESLKLYKNIWKQISERFKDKSYKLIFEVLNEPRIVKNGVADWEPAAEEPYNNLNMYNEELLKSIRETGEKNSSRWVLIPTYGTQITNKVFEKMKIPTDKYVAISVHGYIPYEYCDSTTASYGSIEQNAISYQLGILSEFSKNRNIPVVITELGCRQKETRKLWFRDIYFEAGRYNIPIIYWDNGVLNNEYGIFDRNSLSFPEQLLVDNSNKYYDYGINIPTGKNAIEGINTSQAVFHTQLNGIGIRKENEKNYYYMNLTPPYFSSFDFFDMYEVSDCGIYEFSFKIKTDMKQLLLRLVLNFYDENNNLLFSTSYTPVGYGIDGSKSVYEDKTVWRVEGAKKVKLEKIALSDEAYYNVPVNFEFYDLKLTDIK